MLPVALALLLHAPPAPRVDAPVVTSTAGSARKTKMALLFRRFDAFFPAYCVVGGKLRLGNACVDALPRAPEVRRMTGERVKLQRLARHPVSAWDGPPRRGWALPEADAGDEGEAGFAYPELAVWPADANPGLEPLPPSTATVHLDGLKSLPQGGDEAFRVKETAVSDPRDAWPPTVEQVIELGALGTAVVVSGARRGLFLEAPTGWRALRPEGAAEVATVVVGRADLDADGRVEWLVFVKGWNEFAFEVWTTDFSKVLFAFNDCGV